MTALFAHVKSSFLHISILGSSGGHLRAGSADREVSSLCVLRTRFFQTSKAMRSVLQQKCMLCTVWLFSSLVVSCHIWYILPSRMVLCEFNLMYKTTVKSSLYFEQLFADVCMLRPVYAVSKISIVPIKGQIASFSCVVILADRKACKMITWSNFLAMREKRRAI